VLTGCSVKCSLFFGVCRRHDFVEIIVIGCGKVGSRFAQILSSEGHNVVIVDNDRNAFKTLGTDFNGITVTGVPIDQDVLRQAGIETADALAAVTPDDNVNIMTCQVAKEIFKVPRVIARIYNPEREHVFHQFGLETICPTNLTVDVIRSLILGDDKISIHNVGDNTFIFRHEKVGKDCIGRRIADIATDESEMVFGVIRKGQFSFPRADIKLDSDDMLVIAQKEN
jgi:trk system potassium uptake protein TrkA